MTSKVLSVFMHGFQPRVVEIEVDLNRGKPCCVIIGLPNQAINEAKERVTSALQNSNIRIKSQRTIINLAPADLKKNGSNFDLAIAVALLVAYKEIVLDSSQILWLGELSLMGEVKPIRGLLPIALAARKMGIKRLVFSAEQLSEIEFITDLELFPIVSLADFIKKQRNQQFLPYEGQTEKVLTSKNDLNSNKKTQEFNIENIVGQSQAKRALEIAAAGGHNLLLIGPPGVGKSALAKCLPSILPELNFEEQLEVSQIHALVRPLNQGLITVPPFRSPHHSISFAGLVGGGASLAPGEISLAHGGILFLDEFLEFNRQVLETLRQPLEDRKITITRLHGQVTYPAAFTLIATCNPCPCGYFGSSSATCKCSPTILERYQQKLSGPLLDRIDLRVRVEQVQSSSLSARFEQSTSDSVSVAQKILHAKKIQANRYSKIKIHQNADLRSNLVKFFCWLDSDAEDFYVRAVEKLKISTRSYFKILTVARTIADLGGHEQIQISDLAEALSYRNG